ncbi:hypothetical protein AVEN_267548-1, partial [Araneus ventricosus]
MAWVLPPLARWIHDGLGSEADQQNRSGDGRIETCNGDRNADQLDQLIFWDNKCRKDGLFDGSYHLWVSRVLLRATRCCCATRCRPLPFACRAVGWRTGIRIGFR